MKDLFFGIFLCLVGGGIIFFLEKFDVSNARSTVKIWMIAVALVVVGLYFLAKFFGVDFRV